MSNGYFFKNEENVCLNIPYMEAYIPDEYFKDEDTDSTIACEYGEGFKAFGIFAVRLFPSEDTPRNKVKIRTFAYPNPIITYPSDSVVEKLKLFDSDEGDGIRYRVLKYYKGDIVMSAISKRDIVNCEKFINLITKGKIPQTIPYDLVEDLWMKNLQINNFSSGTPALVNQIILSEMNRNPADPSQQFRKLAGTGKVSMYDGRWFNMNEVSSFTNVLAAMSFERISDKITTSINMTKSGKEQAKTPLERIMSM